MRRIQTQTGLKDEKYKYFQTLTLCLSPPLGLGIDAAGTQKALAELQRFRQEYPKPKP